MLLTSHAEEPNSVARATADIIKLGIRLLKWIF